MSGNQLEDKIFFEAGHTLGKWNCLQMNGAIIWLLILREIMEFYVHYTNLHISIFLISC